MPGSISVLRNKMMKINQNIHSWFLKDRVTKYLHLQINLLIMVGLFKSPQSLNKRSTFHNRSSTLQWRNSTVQNGTQERSTLHQLHMAFSFTFFSTFLILNYICAITKSSKEFAEFSIVIVELVGMTMLFAQTIIFHSKQAALIELLKRMDKFDLNGQRRIFTICRRLECLAFFVFYAAILFISLLRHSASFSPINAQSAAHVQSIYGFKYPQNRLPQCLGIPFVDTSEPRWFYVLYVLEVYAALLMIAMCLPVVFPSIQLHLSGQYFVLARRLESLGNSQQRLTKERQVLEIKACIIFHQKLLQFRELYDSVCRPITTLQICFCFLITSVAGYVFSVRTQFSFQKEGLLLTELIAVLGFINSHCIMSEIFDWVHSRIWYAVYQSQWYTLCPEVQRMMLMILRRTQGSHHLRIMSGMVVLRNAMCISYIRALYSFVKFMRLQKKTK